ncbi:MAG: sigma-54-dependent Fis family transcriptional regulator [Planctomycetota bacterium]|nr:MAG: sigma-54-dependent Fis family transcriptional regulator [Planctomycetota bacterium]
MTQSQTRVLIVDDDKIIVESLIEFLKLEGYEAIGAESFAEAIASLERATFNLVITDINMPNTDGFELLRIIKQRYPHIVVIMITGYGTIESAVEAIKMGAYDYLTKPIIDDEISLVVERALKQQSLIQENQSLREALDLRYNLDNIVGHSYQMLKIFDLIESVAESRTNVLIQGESGTGKSLIARAIHHRSDRSDHPFVEVSCGALPESLLESELFGHVKGSFTGAVGDKVGKFKAANNGTIFLDEISSSTPVLQVKLLRVLQERQFESVGSNKTETVDVRVILACNEDLAKAVESGRFRQDLFYRINVVTIHLPSLRERLGDILLLAEHFLKNYRAESKKEINGFSDECMQYLQRYHWPGNVRELENVIERAIVLTKNRRIEVSDLPENVIQGAQTSPQNEDVFKPMPLKKALEEPEKRIIEKALRANNWNRQTTAQLLEINRTTLYKKMKRYGLEIDPIHGG